MNTIAVAAKGVIVSHGWFLLIKESISGKDVWDLPGGKVKFRESPQETVVREIKEETQLEVQVKKLLGVYWFFKYRGGGQVICITYLCKPLHTRVDLSKNPAVQEQIISYQWVGKKDFLEKDFGVNPSLKELIGQLKI